MFIKYVSFNADECQWSGYGNLTNLQCSENDLAIEY